MVVIDVENKLELPLIWSIAPESMTHLEEEEIRHPLGLPGSTRVEVRKCKLQ